jgi:hypothetical protein
MSGVTPATAPVNIARRSSKFAGKNGKYTLPLTNPHKKLASGQPFKSYKAIFEKPCILKKPKLSHSWK